ncbi:DUF2490 domain-containing protein [Candidatus Babeliales bacterium]|nr:DUF2490 domain-containing protein [Candidatus Babeliales bacterium]
MRKIYKATIILFLFYNQTISATDWQLWTTIGAEKKLNKNLKIKIDLENRFKNDFDNHFYTHGEPSIHHKIINDDNSIGLQFRQIYEESSSGKWKLESRPGIIWLTKFSLLGSQLDSRIKVIYRVLERSSNRIAFRGRLGFEIFKISPISGYISDELFYHYNGLDQIDRNRLILGMKINIKTKKLSVDAKTYLLRQDNKRSAFSSWKGTNAIGGSITIKF